METKPIKRPFKKGASIFDKINLASLKPDKYELSPTLEKIKERWVFSFTEKLQGNSRHQIAKDLQETYDISEAQAYLDIKNSDHYYGDAHRANQQAEKVILYEFARDTYKQAVEDGDLKMRLKAIDLMGKYADIGKDDIQQFNPEKFENKEVSVTVPTAVMDALIEKLKGGVVNMNQLEAEDAQFVEVDSNEEN
ncbi:hypothetical protein [Croceibacter atlanticus]|uniref:hypothetical protein n=1 Tax=Croceibacter atlanticus TaxID=313588 RepID=UPI0030D82CAA|tara:strand:+ start:13449 stop:14030 length:582 start_codon:yes stop_codon:yes gene_type:complete